MSDRRASILASFDRHEAFTVSDEEVIVGSTPFDARVAVDLDGDESAYTFVATLPSLDAIVEGERVSDVVVDGWAETLDRRLRDAGGVTPDLDGMEADIEWDRQRVEVRMTFVRPAGTPAPTDAVVALANYVDGTYLQGIIPGYDYGPPVDEMLSQARQRADEETPEPPDERDFGPPSDAEG